jgi:hypothetical protein
MHRKPNELFQTLVQIKDEINQQIPLAANRFEEFECVPSYRHLSEEEAYALEEKICQQSKQHDKEMDDAQTQYHVYQHLNTEFQRILTEDSLSDPKTRFKKEAVKIYHKLTRTNQLLGKALTLDISDIETHIDRCIEEKWEALLSGKMLTLSNADLANRFEQMERLVAHRSIAQTQYVVNNQSKRMNASKEAEIVARKAFVLSTATYWARIKTQVGFCDEHTVLGLYKIFEKKLCWHTKIEKVNITYFDEANNPDDGHTFLAINRRPDSELNHISSWGDEAILFDPWNKLVCYAKDYLSLPHQYFSYPDGAEWTSLEFTQQDYRMFDALNEQDEYFFITENSDIAKREKLLIEEYQLISLNEPRFANCKKVLGECVSKSIPPDFRYHVEVYLTTRGQQPVKTLYGFSEPKIAIHVDFLKDIIAGVVPQNSLLFGIQRSLFFIKHFSLCNDDSISDASHFNLDKLTVTQFNNALSAIEYLRYCIPFDEKQTESHAFKVPDVDVGLFRETLRDVYLKRIKYLNTLLAQDERLRKNNSKQEREFDIHLLKTELAEIPDRLHSYPDFPKHQSILEQLVYLTAKVPTLREELLPYELIEFQSIRIKDFCKCLRDIPFNLADPSHSKAIDQLINAAFELKIPAFDMIYRAALKAEEKYWFDKLALQPLGIFREFQATIDQFVQANDYPVAINAAEKILWLNQALSNHFFMHPIGQSAREYVKHYKIAKATLPTGQERFFGSRVGWNIAWRSFTAQDQTIPWEKHLLWCQQDNQQRIAKVLWRLGVLRDTRLWKHLQFQQMIQFINCFESEDDKEIYRPLVELEGMLSEWGDTESLDHTAHLYLSSQSQNHRLQPLLADASDEKFEASYLQFYEANLPALIGRSQTLNQKNETIHYLLTRFTEVALHGTPKNKQVVKSFYLGRQDNKDLKNLSMPTNGFPVKHFDLLFDAPYVQFLIDVQTKHDDMFSVDEIFEILMNTNLGIKGSSIPPECYIKLLKLPFTELNLDCLHHLVPLFKKQMLLEHLGKHVALAHVNQFGPYPLLSAEAVKIAKLVNGHWYCNDILKTFVWPTGQAVPTVSNVSLKNLIFLYRLCDTYLTFPNLDAQRYLSELIVNQLKSLPSPEEKITLLEKMLFVHKKRTKLPLSDIVLRNTLVEMWIDSQVKVHGKDINTLSYYNSMVSVIDKVFADGASRDTAYILNKLTEAIRSQQKLSDYIGTRLEPKKYVLVSDKKSFENKALNTLAEVASLLGKNKQDQLAFLDFLSAPISPESLDVFANYLIMHKKASEFASIMGYAIDYFQSDNTIVKHVAHLFYFMFWGCRLEERAVAINYLLLPPKTELSDDVHHKAYQEALIYVASKLFPNAGDPKSDDHVALAFLNAYLTTANPHLRSYLLSAMLVTSNDIQAHQTNRVGKKLSLLCEHMGPAYVKMAQAIHSHPKTPEDIRHDLDHIKGKANPPTRWHLWRLIAETLPLTLRHKITHVGELLGSASYNMALEVSMVDGSKNVLLLLRENAEKEAKEGFAHLKATVLFCQHPKIISIRNALVEMIQEASDLSMHELNHICGDQQHQIAQAIYPNSTVTLDHAQLQIHPVKSYFSGPGFRVIEYIPGIEFNDLPKSTTQEIALRKTISKAILTIELTNILSGDYFDCDRHGNQLRIQTDEIIKIGLYDFGEMALQKATPEELKQLISVIQDFPKAILQNISFDTLFSDHIEKAMAMQQTPHYLMRIRKALLALQDFQKTITHQDLLAILETIAKSQKVSPVIQETYSQVINKISAMQWFYTKISLFRTQPQQATNQESKTNSGSWRP